MKRITVDVDLVYGSPIAVVSIERYGNGAICLEVFKTDKDYPTRAYLTEAEAERVIAALRAAIEDGRDTTAHGA